MEPVSLSVAAVAAIVAYLSVAANEVATTAAKSAGKAVWEWAKSKLVSRQGVDVLDEFATDPKDPDNQKAVEATLSKFLRSNPVAAKELASLLRKSAGGTNKSTVTASGGAVAVGRDSVGSTITTNRPRSSR